MKLETESERRARLRMLGESLIEASNDQALGIESVRHEIHGSTCALCEHYGREAFEVITVVYSR